MGTTLRVENDIRWFEIAVQNTVIVGVLHRVGNLSDHFGSPPDWQGALSCYQGQVTTRDQIHREIVLAFNFTHLVDRYDPGVFETCGCGCFGPKPLDLFGGGQRTVKHHFYRDLSVQTDLPSAIDHPHPATSNFLHELVVSHPARHAEWTRQVRRWRDVWGEGKPGEAPGA